MSVGDLTTTFTPPSSCLSAFDNNISFNGWMYYIGPVETGNCFPPGYRFQRTNYYSPGICPVGFTSACASTAGSETIITCCPGTALSCNTETSKFTTDTWASTMGCNSFWTDTITLPTVTIIDGTKSLTVTSRIDSLGALNAYSVQIRFRATDFQITASAASTDAIATAKPTPASSPSSIAAVTSASSVTTQTPVTTEETSPSSGTVVGIAVGCVLGSLLLAGIVISAFLVGRRSARRKRVMETELDNTGSGGADHQPWHNAHEGEYKDAASGRSYVTTEPVEIWGYERPAELPAARAPIEMPSHDHYR